MSITAQQLVEDALDDLEVKSSEVELTTSELKRGIRSLNRLMAQFASTGLNIGYNKVDQDKPLTDTNIPDWFEDCAITFLAIRLAPSYGVIDVMLLSSAAREALKVVQKRLVQIGEVNYPNTLPIGSGNFQDNNQYFFTDDTVNDLLGGNSQSVSDGTEDQIEIDF